MDKLRIVLFMALFAISFMLITNFVKFKDDKSKAQLLTQNSMAVDANKGVKAEIPSETSTATSALETDIQSEKSTSLIKVETDNFVLSIDPKGGDIVNVALKKYLARIDTPNIPFTILENTDQRTYIAQSGLIGKNGTDKSNERPLFNSIKKEYTLNENDKSLFVDLTYVENGVTLIKRFEFERDSYLININYVIKNQSSENWEASFYAQIKRDASEDPSAQNGNMGIYPYLGFATTTVEEKFKKIEFDDIETTTFENKEKAGWIAMIQHYFLAAWIPDANQTHEYSALKSSTGNFLARVKSPNTIVKAGEDGIIQSSIYIGPKNQYSLEKISKGLDLSVDYGVLWMIAQPLYALLYFFNKGEFHMFGIDADIFAGFGNWGFSIILLTVFVKLCFFSLNAKAYKSMAKMRAIQPKMLEIKDRFADDKQRQSKEMMALYSKEGVNPLGGCLPMVVQMPVFMALYWVLLESVELRHAPFIGYIHDLSAMDPYFILPVIMGFSMWFQQKLNPPPTDPMQAKVMQFLPIIFTFFFLFFPAGLVLYWVVNNTLSIAQQWIITKNIEKETISK